MSTLIKAVTWKADSKGNVSVVELDNIPVPESPTDIIRFYAKVNDAYFGEGEWKQCHHRNESLPFSPLLVQSYHPKKEDLDTINIIYDFGDGRNPVDYI